jgi:hypothetical protein
MRAFFSQMVRPSKPVGTFAMFSWQKNVAMCIVEVAVLRRNLVTKYEITDGLAGEILPELSSARLLTRRQPCYDREQNFDRRTTANGEVSIPV